MTPILAGPRPNVYVPYADCRPGCYRRRKFMSWEERFVDKVT
eukprot:SAG11_NODE_19183_length_472_cov_1.179625_2_plen_41_part_01